MSKVLKKHRAALNAALRLDNRVQLNAGMGYGPDQRIAGGRVRNSDLFTVALARPHLSSQPALDANKIRPLADIFPTRPLQINFDLLFANVGGQWRLFGISVATPQVPVQPPAAEAPKAAPA